MPDGMWFIGLILMTMVGMAIGASAAGDRRPNRNVIVPPDGVLSHAEGKLTMAVTHLQNGRITHGREEAEEAQRAIAEYREALEAYRQALDGPMDEDEWAEFLDEIADDRNGGGSWSDRWEEQ